jgi:hypothetical protein
MSTPQRHFHLAHRLSQDRVFTMDHSPCGPDVPLPQFPCQPDIPDQEQQLDNQESTPELRLFQEFAKLLSPSETPLTRSLNKPVPSYCWETVKEPREPEHSIWVKAKELLQSITPEDMDNDFWEASQAWYDLDHIVRQLYKVAFNMIPNPEYDSERCAEWRSANPGRMPIDQKKITWGTSKVNKVTNEREYITYNGDSDSNSTG